MMRFKESRLWTMTESGNLSVRTARHPGQGGLEQCKPGWRVFSSSGSHASHPDLSFIPVSCCLKFFLLRSHKWECVYRLNYVTTQSSVKKPLFSGFQNHWTLWIHHLTFLPLAIIFIMSCFPCADPHSDSNPPIRERSNCVQKYSDLITCTGWKSLITY